MATACENIVILGAGIGGLILWNHLERSGLDKSKYNVVLVNPSNHYFHRIAGIRGAVTTEDNFHERAWAELREEKFNRGSKKLVTGSATLVEENHDGTGTVTLDTGVQIPYTYLVLATGCSWDGHLAYPPDKASGTAWSASWRAKFEKSESIILVGGGAISVETAGEIKEIYPSKKVTIVHSRDLLLNDAYPQWWRERLTDRVRDLGVDLVLSDYVDETALSSEGTISTRSGRVLEADLILSTRGPKPNTDYLKALGKDTVTKSGHVKVSPTLQLPDHPNIFAVGDIIDWNEQKTGSKTVKHASVVAKNVVALTKGQTASQQYRGAIEKSILTLGKSGGYGFVDIFGGLTVPSWWVSLTSAKYLLIRHVNHMV